MSATNTQAAIDALAQTFQRFAERECKGYSPLHEQLALALAADAHLLWLAAQAPPGQPAPNLLLASCIICCINNPITHWPNTIRA